MAYEKNKKIYMADSFSNRAARLGYGTFDLLQATEYPLTRLTYNYPLLTSLYRNNWIIQNIISTIPNDMVRKWYELRGSLPPDALNQMIRVERRTQIRRKLLLGMYWGRLYGGAAGILLVRGQENLEEPLQLDAVLPGSFLGLQILDRWSGIYPESELVSDPSDSDFGLPEYYSIRDEVSGETAARVHHSRVLRFIGRELPYMEQITEQYWGESEIEAIYEELVKRDNVSGNIAALTFRANLNYLETDNLDQMMGIANTEVQRRFWQTLQAQSIIESNFGTRLINKGDKMHNTQYTFTGLSDVYDRVMMDVAGAARTPVTKLFGRSPAGLNATGESDMQNYYDYIDGLRETEFRFMLERLLPVLALSAWGEVPDDLDIAFPPLQTPDSKEVAEIAEKKTGAVVMAYQSDLLDSATAQMELQSLSDDAGLFSNISEDSIKQGKGQWYSDQKGMRDVMAGLMIPEERIEDEPEEGLEDGEAD